MNKSKLGAVALAAAIVASTSLAQNAVQAAEKHYRLDFTVKEVEAGNVTNTRVYSTMFATESHDRSSIRTGNKVPYQSSPSSMQYIDLGVNIDINNGKDLPEGLGMYVQAEVTSGAAAGNESGTHFTLPLLRNTRWSSSVVVPLNKPTLLFSSDDPSSKRKMQLELTAVPLR